MLVDNISKIIDLIISEYSHFCKFESWMSELKIPIDLEWPVINDYISDYTIFGYFNSENQKIVEEYRLYVRPQWDLEHCIFIGIENGKIKKFHV